MTDLKLVYAPDTLSADLALDGLGLATDDGLESAVIVSLFTDRRADPGDTPPAGDDDRRGWWADALAPRVAGEAVTGDRIGSRLWLLAREKQIPATLARAKAYAEEALAWLIEDRVAEAVTVRADWGGAGILALDVSITRPGRPLQSFRFDHVWPGGRGAGGV